MAANSSAMAPRAMAPTSATGTANGTVDQRGVEAEHDDAQRQRHEHGDDGQGQRKEEQRQDAPDRAEGGNRHALEGSGDELLTDRDGDVERRLQHLQDDHAHCRVREVRAPATGTAPTRTSREM